MPARDPRPVTRVRPALAHGSSAGHADDGAAAPARGPATGRRDRADTLNGGLREVQAMQDAELFLSLAEIAGVFVGFGALIAVRSGGASERDEIAYMRAMVTAGLLTIVAALAPVLLARYGLSDHGVWAGSSALVLVGFVVAIAANVRTPEYRENWTAEWQAARAGPRWFVAVDTATYAIYMVSLVLVPVVVLLGLLPGLEAALYATVVGLILLGAAWILLSLVLSHRAPAGA